MILVVTFDLLTELKWNYDPKTVKQTEKFELHD